MPVDISAHYTLDSHPISHKKLELLTRWFMKQLEVTNHTVSLLLVDDEEIRWLNSQYRNKDTATNVLSFALTEGEADTLDFLPINELGDIIISLDTALRESIEFGQSLQYRMSWLILHGLLHLLGHDHERSEQEAEDMYAKEQELLKRLEHYRRHIMPQLAINVDHVATVRQARGTTEPDPVTAAGICELAGASGIVVHLREDRRHIQDRDVQLLRQTIKTRMNLEMGATKEMIGIAQNLVPDMVTLVPEKRQELTTEGGLDVVGQQKKITKAIEKLSQKNIPVSLFVDPDIEQIAASRQAGATFVEIHTGRYSDALSDEERDLEFTLIEEAAQEAFQMGLRVNAGHGLDYINTARVAALDTIEELSIGHAVISRAVFVGLDQAVREMLAIVQQAKMSF
ncbi:pyridoxine 5'-phosphate synthase [Desulfosediminicola flagellatus]|uniref:pyridoxine 5'-phosphate synthase n=1 Tax=Desulfosediminicola flagellatus TaxID=2569541 RepID=UPI0010AD1539|nr:pyridoxine 5'-phosphate synthase [Desulfosediminicola flagellatus]